MICWHSLRRFFKTTYASDLAVNKDPDGEVENPGKSIFEIRNQNFCYIQVLVFDVDYLPVAAVGTWE